ncbi:hypothetical protein ABZ759_26305 [Streptomyces sp. NPDC047860]|uniref:hypothetical protein n=1 Tax=Streptomyces sp. NPDC047860 TaxID=3155743 RepID=UPI0033C3F04D
MTPWQLLRQDEWPTLRELLASVFRQGKGTVLGLLILSVCAWNVTIVYLPLYPLVRSARHKARELFHPNARRRIHDPEVERIQKVRAWSATIVSFLILAVFGTSEDWGQAQQQATLRLVATPWLLLLSVPVVVGLLFRLASPSNKTAMRRGLRHAARSALWYFGSIGVIGATTGTMALTGLLEDGWTWWRLVPLFALTVPMLWGFSFVGYSTRTAIRTAFNSASIHEMVPAVLTCALVWEFAVIGLLFGGLPPGPLLIQICALLGGPASVSAVAWWEISRLRTLHGVTLRT